MKTVRPKHTKKTTNTSTKWRLESVYSRMGASLRNRSQWAGLQEASSPASPHLTIGPTLNPGDPPDQAVSMTSGPALLGVKPPRRGPATPVLTTPAKPHSSGQDNVLWYPHPFRAHSATPRGWPDPSTHIPSPAARVQPKWGRPKSLTRKHTALRVSCHSPASRDWERRSTGITFPSCLPAGPFGFLAKVPHGLRPSLASLLVVKFRLTFAVGLVLMR